MVKFLRGKYLPQISPSPSAYVIKNTTVLDRQCLG